MLIYSHDTKPDMQQLHSLPAVRISLDSKRSPILWLVTTHKTAVYVRYSNKFSLQKVKYSLG
jgi:hypothetical protein